MTKARWRRRGRAPAPATARAALHAVAVPSALALFASGLVLGDAPAARAHMGSVKYVAVEPLETGAHVTVEIDVIDAAVELGLGEDASEDAVLARAGDVSAWLARGITLRRDGADCTADGTPATPLEGEESPPRLVVELDYACPGSGGRLVLHDATVFPTDARHESFVRERFGTGEETRVLRVGRQDAELGEPASMGALAWQFVVEGVDHLLTGYDHMLFLLSLLLTAGETARRAGRRKALRDVGIVVTAFTLGHSVTLFAAALGWVVLPTRLVESVIAGSIVVVALLNVWRPEERREMPYLAGFFGLIHGFGFSGVLAELGLPARARVLSLLSFNVGIELAQLACVAVAIVPLEWLARQKGYRNGVVRGGSVVIALLAAFWMFERITGRG